MTVTIDQIKELRDLTGISIADCKNALIEAKGDQKKAVEILEKRGLDKAALRSTKEAKEGVVGYYIHQNQKVAAIVEVNCETDFVARTDDFKELAHNLAMQVAASDPKFLDRASISAKVKKEEKDLDLYSKENVFLEQDFVKDSSKTVQDMLSSYIAKFGENIKIGSFYRISISK